MTQIVGCYDDRKMFIVIFIIIDSANGAKHVFYVSSFKLPYLVITYF